VPPEHPELLIHSLELDEIPAALALLDETLGAGYISQTELEQYLSTSEKFLLAAANREGRLQGVLLAHLDTQGAIPQLTPAQAQLVESSTASERQAFIKSLAVQKTARGQGIGTSLILAAEGRLWGWSASVIVTLAWADQHGCHLEGVLTKLNYRLLDKTPRFWYQDSLSKGYQCPTCGNPCECAAWLFAKDRTK
jgi:GNAT superfamily N-acetyltransferase